MEAAALEEADTVLIATVGFSGLPPLMRSIQTDKRIALANKESIVCGGNVVMSALKEHGQRILPDRQRAFGDLPVHGGVKRRKGSSRIVLIGLGRASGTRPRNNSTASRPVRPSAIRGGTWAKKISVDSATLMNKGFEVIEAHWLFGAPVDAIDVVIHPESIVCTPSSS